MDTITTERERISEMPAGPEMDACVASLLGWKHCEDDPEASADLLVSEGGTLMHPPGRRTDCIIFATDVPKFSTDIAPAWQVVEHLNCLEFSVARENCEGVRYDATCYDRPDMLDITTASGETAALAICRAALLMKLLKSSDPNRKEA